MKPFYSQRIRLEALNGFLENLAGDSDSPARRFGGNDPHAPVEQVGAPKSRKPDVS